MKKIIYFVFAALALVACEPNNGATEKVRIGVSLDDHTQPGKGPQRISAIDGATEIDINWGEGDMLYYQLNRQEIDKNNPFKIVSGVGKKQAFFECDAMISSNDEFTLYYHGAAEPDFQNPLITDQIVTINNEGEEVINNDYLMYTATNCKIGSAVMLQPNFAILGVKIKGEVADLNHLVGHYAILGEGKENSQNVYISCKINGATQKNELIYYYVIPYTGGEINLQGKYFWIAAMDGKHEYSNEMQINKLCVLTPGIATIVELSIKYNESASSNAGLFTLSSTNK